MQLSAKEAYASTKDEAEQITRQPAKEFGARGISISAIAPGTVKTELFLREKN